MTKKTVLAIGIDPVFLDFTTLPQFTPEMFRSHIDAQIGRLRALGYDVASCLIDLGETAEETTATALKTLRLRLNRCRIAAAAGTSGAVRKDHQPDPRARPGSLHLLQHHSG
jgi:hypothetical protein